MKRRDASPAGCAARTDDHDGPCAAWARKARWDSVTGGGDSRVLGLEQSAVFRRAVDAGINFIDTCDYYSVGNSEEIVGALIAEHGSRSEFVAATKVGNQMDLDASARGYSRKHIIEAAERSLRRAADRLHRPAIAACGLSAVLPELRFRRDKRGRAGNSDHLGGHARRLLTLQSKRRGVLQSRPSVAPACWSATAVPWNARLGAIQFIATRSTITSSQRRTT